MIVKKETALTPSKKSDIKKSKAKYIQIAEYLQQKIDTGEYQPAAQIPSESQLMKQFGVSRIVVINALTRLTNAGSIVRRPGKGSFVMDSQTASALNLSILTKAVDASSPSIALIIPSVMDSYSITLAQEIVIRAKIRNAFCSIYYTNGNLEMEENVLRHVYQSHYMGAVLFPADQESKNEVLCHLIEQKFPIVLIDREIPGLEISCVQTDHNNAARTAVSELVKLGHKKIALCSETPLPTCSVTQRIEGYLSQLKQSGIPVDPSLILAELNQPIRIRELENVILSRSATAFICLSLNISQLVHDKVLQYGYTFPRDFSLITFDDPRQHNWQTEYPSSILQNASQIGQNAVDILFGMIEKHDFNVKLINIPSFYLTGNTTAPPENIEDMAGDNSPGRRQPL